MNKLSLDHRLLENFSWPLMLALVGLCFCGLINLYSMSSSGVFVNEWSWFLRQSYFLGLGLVGLMVLLLVDYQYLKKIIWAVYFLNIMALVSLFFIGITVNGSTRWLDLGLFRFQPSEVVKVVTVVTLAAWLAKIDLSAGLDFKDLVVPGLVISVPFALIFSQPDLGTALHLLATCVPLLLVFRLRLRLFLSVVLTGVLLAGVIVSFLVSGAWIILVEKGILEPHQVTRIENFLDQRRDPSGSGWQVMQSQNAVGAGQILGRGFMEGSQHKHGFLPEAETDFAFAALAEEWGFAGAMLVLSLFLCLLSSGLALAQKSKDCFGSLIALGMTALMFWQVVINVGMVIGLLPVVGIPLPFISYGGTSVVVTFIAVALILNVGMRRYIFQEEAIKENPLVWSLDISEGVPTVVTVPVRRLTTDTPFNPGLHPQYRLPHVRPWTKYLRKGRSRLSGWQAPDLVFEE